MEELQTQSQELQSAEAVGPYCPICGEGMHITVLLGVEYLECNDPECGYIEPA